MLINKTISRFSTAGFLKKIFVVGGGGVYEATPVKEWGKLSVM